MARRRLLHHPAGYMRQGPIGLLHDENVRALKAMRANDGNRLATARMKWIEDPILRSLIPGIMSLSREALEERIEQGETAAQKIDLDEAATRQIVDQQLRDRGWEADSQKLTYAGGARPAKGRASALAEWPTESGPADYALFVSYRGYRFPSEIIHGVLRLQNFHATERAV